jgi:hypothetical protein
MKHGDGEHERGEQKSCILQMHGAYMLLGVGIEET